MTGHTQLAVTPRDRFLQAAQKGTDRFRASGTWISKKGPRGTSCKAAASDRQDRD